MKKNSYINLFYFRFVQSVPSALDSVSDTAVQGFRIIPGTVNTANDFTVSTINRLPDAVDSTVDLAAAVPGHAVRVVHGVPVAANSAFNTIRTVPGRFVSFGNNAFNTIQTVPSTAFR